MKRKVSYFVPEYCNVVMVLTQHFFNKIVKNMSRCIFIDRLFAQPVGICYSVICQIGEHHFFVGECNDIKNGGTLG